MSELDAIADQAPSRVPLKPDAITAMVTLLGSRWSHENGELVLALAAQGMARTGAVAAYAGALADELDHHPTITLSYPGLRLAINTHDVGAITVLDVIFCARLERWLRSSYPTA